LPPNPPPGQLPSITLDAILVELQGMRAEVDARLAAIEANTAGGGGVPAELTQIVQELSHLRAMFHYRQWEHGGPIDPAFPAMPDRTDPVGPFPP
jgi:hypothetical protein